MISVRHGRESNSFVPALCRTARQSHVTISYVAGGATVPIRCTYATSLERTLRTGMARDVWRQIEELAGEFLGQGTRTLRALA